jgi:hypothetical protein
VLTRVYIAVGMQPEPCADLGEGLCNSGEWGRDVL